MIEKGSLEKNFKEKETEFNRFVDEQLEPHVEQKIAVIMEADEMTFADHHIFGSLKERIAVLEDNLKQQQAKDRISAARVRSYHNTNGIIAVRGVKPVAGEGVTKTLLDATNCADDVFNLVDRFVSNGRYFGTSPLLILVHTRYLSIVKKLLIDGLL